MSTDQSSDYSEWTYYVAYLDGANDYQTEAEAQKFRREGSSRIPVEERRMWRERTEYQEVDWEPDPPLLDNLFPGMPDELARLSVRGAE